jgi:hypothetical protein
MASRWRIDTICCRFTSLFAARGHSVAQINSASKRPASSSVGRIEAAAVIGYSPDEQLVRWMEIFPTGNITITKVRGEAIEIGVRASAVNLESSQ